MQLSQEQILILVILVVFLITFTGVGSYLYGKSCGGPDVVENYRNTKNSKLSFADYLAFYIYTSSDPKLNRIFDHVFKKYGVRDHKYNKAITSRIQKYKHIFSKRKWSDQFMLNLNYTGLLDLPHALVQQIEQRNTF